MKYTRWRYTKKEKTSDKKTFPKKIILLNASVKYIMAKSTNLPIWTIQTRVLKLRFEFYFACVWLCMERVG